MIGNIAPLVGRHFISATLNRCCVSRMGDGAVRAHWVREPSADDVAEFSLWVEGLLAGPIPLALTVCTDPENEAAEFDAWKREQRANR